MQGDSSFWTLQEALFPCCCIWSEPYLATVTNGMTLIHVLKAKRFTSPSEQYLLAFAARS